jgi:hypothetical protein
VWPALVIAAVMLAGHGAFLYYFSSHRAASTALFAGVIFVVAFEHLALLQPFYALLRKWRGRP